MGRLWRAFKAFAQALRAPSEEETQKKIPAKPDHSHLRMLALLQSSGRLIDFLQEDISEYNDAQVGAAVRKVHADCRQVLEELVTIRPVMEQQEGSQVKVSAGFDPAQIKVIGNVKGEPPYEGELVHAGWTVKKVSLPKEAVSHATEVLQPAEIEVR